VFFPEFLLQLSARDQQVTWLDPFIIRVPALAAVTPLPAAVAIPAGRALILQSATLTFTPGAAQLALRAAIAISNGVFSANLRFEQFGAGSNVVGGINWSGSIIVPPTWSVLSNVVFDLGAAVNSSNLDLQGVLIPIANIQRV